MREILVELERNRVRLVVRHGEDETVLKLNLQEAQTLSDDLEQALEDYQQRKHIRID
ncbi:MAG: hypothetical protein C5S43_05745 [Candidatus Methanocomedens sp.]|nr:MAG: hypothetical protein C5S43_05745 [ANME-2 cluster archaeon]